MGMPEQRKVIPINKGGTKKPVYGWVPDLPDHRDIMYSAVRMVPANLPPLVDLRNYVLWSRESGTTWKLYR